MSNIADKYKEAEDLVFRKRPARYQLDIQSDRASHTDSRLLQQHTEAIEATLTQMEKATAVVEKMKIPSKEIHSNLPPNPVDQAIPHGIDMDWN